MYGDINGGYNNTGGGGIRRRGGGVLLDTADFYRHVPKELCEVRTTNDDYNTPSYIYYIILII